MVDKYIKTNTRYTTSFNVTTEFSRKFITAFYLQFAWFGETQKISTVAYVETIMH